MNNLDILPHNKRASEKVREKFETDDLAAIVHATGTGKNFIFLDLALQNSDKKFVFLAPSVGIIEHIKGVIEENNLKLDNIEFRTYQSLINMSNEELEFIDMDYLILDEFHHIGAPIWGNRVKTLIENHPGVKILGMSAYTVRNRGKNNENDLTNPFTDELFSGKVVSTYPLSTAIIDKVLPLPIYKSAYIDYETDIEILKDRLSKLKKGSAAFKDISDLIARLEQKIKYAKNMGDIFKNNIKNNGKYYYFCPINGDINSIKETVRKWLHEMGLSDNDYIFYETTGEMGTQGKNNRDAFYHDKDLDGNLVNNKLRIMFAINQYNEGVHAPNVDGVIMGRDTRSDIIFYEQIGRALSVINDDALIIDLAGNIEFMYYLQDCINKEIKHRNSYRKNDNPTYVAEEPFEFNIGLMNVDILELVGECESRLGMGFYDNYNLAKVYYQNYGNLLIPAHFNTFDGMNKNEDGIQLGQWIRTIRKSYKEGRLSSGKIDLLNEIGMVWENIDIEEKWFNNYALASIFYKTYGNLEIPTRFKTIDGIHYDENGVSLGSWIRTQRTAYKGKGGHKITPLKIDLLNDIGMRWDNIDQLAIWKSKYFYAKRYFLEHGDLAVPDEYDCGGGFNLKIWLKNQKANLKNLNDDQITLLEDINFNFDKKDYDVMWKQKYILYKNFVEFYGTVKVPSGFRTLDGISYNENGIYLDVWYNYQFKRHSNGKLDETEKFLLEDLGVVFPVERK